MSAPFRRLVRLRAGELADAMAERGRTAALPSSAALARSAARVATAQAVHFRRRVLAYPIEVRVLLAPAAWDRVAGAVAAIEAEVTEQAWVLARRWADADDEGPPPGRFRVRLGLDPALDTGHRAVASRTLGGPVIASAPASTLAAPAQDEPARAGERPVALRLRVLDGRPVAAAPPGAVLSVGRGRDNDLVVDDPRASGRHLVVEWRGAVAVVQDLGSTNGTWHNGRLVTSAALGDGDRLRIGRTVLVVDLPGDPAAGPATEPAAGPATHAATASLV
ncbi:MAG: FHA domain-containing protein [Acidimicrobiales bacterium]|nr:FHA domain-containing protein [Acidimicrobiales bacterium]